VTHAPARGVLDEAYSHDPTVGEPMHIGSQALRDLVDRARPRLHLFGHVHHRFGVRENAVNGSYPDSRKFISIDLGTDDITFV